MYNYEILNYWNDSDDLYVNYIIEDVKHNKKANVINYYNTADLDCDYNISSNEEIKLALLKLIKENNGIEFNLPKVSEISSLLKYVYDLVCESESNMCHITNEEWLEVAEENNFNDLDIESLLEEIKKYNINDYIAINVDGYKICGYGCLQCCFNDDRIERTDELER